jgi:hypothetical protein
VSRGCSIALASALLITACHDGVAPDASTPVEQSPSMGSVTASLSIGPWTSGHVSVNAGDSTIYILATAWPGSPGGTPTLPSPGGPDTREYLQLNFEARADAVPQIIGVNTRARASLGVEFVGGWIASSGSITLTTLTANRAVGTFTFSGEAEGPIAPSLLTATNGHFDVRLR